MEEEEEEEEEKEEETNLARQHLQMLNSRFLGGCVNNSFIGCIHSTMFCPVPAWACS